VNDTIWTAIITAGAGVLVVVLSKLFGKRDTSYDQIQEDLAGVRADNVALRREIEENKRAAMEERRKDRAQMERMETKIDHLNTEAISLREDIRIGQETGVLPVLHPRPAHPEIYPS
jgi:uncharacterized protein with von Willebrand factor type A (vWA) domain